MDQTEFAPGVAYQELKNSIRTEHSQALRSRIEAIKKKVDGTEYDLNNLHQASGEGDSKSLMHLAAEARNEPAVELLSTSGFQANKTRDQRSPILEALASHGEAVLEAKRDIDDDPAALAIAKEDKAVTTANTIAALRKAGWNPNVFHKTKMHKYGTLDYLVQAGIPGLESQIGEGKIPAINDLKAYPNENKLNPLQRAACMGHTKTALAILNSSHNTPSASDNSHPVAIALKEGHLTTAKKIYEKLNPPLESRLKLVSTILASDQRANWGSKREFLTAQFKEILGKLTQPGNETLATVIDPVYAELIKSDDTDLLKEFFKSIPEEANGIKTGSINNRTLGINRVLRIDDKKYSPLSYACVSGHPEQAAALINLGATKNHADPELDPLFQLVEQASSESFDRKKELAGVEDLVRLLLKKGTPPYCALRATGQTKGGVVGASTAPQSALGTAIRNNLPSLARIILTSMDQSQSSLTNADDTLITDAIKFENGRDRKDICLALINNGMEVSSLQDSPLFQLAENGGYELIKSFVAAKSDINVRNEEGHSILAYVINDNQSPQSTKLSFVDFMISNNFQLSDKDDALLAQEARQASNSANSAIVEKFADAGMFAIPPEQAEQIAQDEPQPVGA